MFEVALNVPVKIYCDTWQLARTCVYEDMGHVAYLVEETPSPTSLQCHRIHVEQRYQLPPVTKPPLETDEPFLSTPQNGNEPQRSRQQGWNTESSTAP